MAQPLSAECGTAVPRVRHSGRSGKERTAGRRQNMTGTRAGPEPLRVSRVGGSTTRGSCSEDFSVATRDPFGGGNQWKSRMWLERNFEIV